MPSLAAIHPDPSHPAHRALLTNLDLKKDSARIYAFAEGGIMLAPQDVLHDSVDEQEVSRHYCLSHSSSLAGRVLTMVSRFTLITAELGQGDRLPSNRQQLVPTEGRPDQDPVRRPADPHLP